VDAVCIPELECSKKIVVKKALLLFAKGLFSFCLKCIQGKYREVPAWIINENSCKIFLIDKREI
jgi:hypothetical protein